MDPRTKSAAPNRWRVLALVLASVMIGGALMGPVSAAVSLSREDRKFIRKTARKIANKRQKNILKNLQPQIDDRYTKAEADAMFLGAPIVYVQGPAETIGAGATKTASAPCPTGTRAVGGGFDVTSKDVIVIQSHPGGAVPGTTWVVIATNTSGGALFIGAWAVCAATTSTTGP